MQGRHTMSGTITTIDHSTGILGLKTEAGELTLHFPPPTIENLKEGETITVSLGFRPGATKSSKSSKSESTQ